MIGDSSPWPFLHLNHLSPVVSPNNPSIHATRAQDLTFPVDSADLSRQLEAWSNVTFAFDDEQPPTNPSPSLPLKPKDQAMAAQSQTFAPGSDVLKSGGDYAPLDDPNPYSSRRAMGTNSTFSVGPTHPLFAHSHDPPFRVGSHLQFDFQNPVFGGQTIDNQPSQLGSFASSSLGISAFMGTPNAENMFSGLPLPYPFESAPSVSADLPNFDGLDGLAGLAELASATSRAPVAASGSGASPASSSPTAPAGSSEVTPQPASAESQSKSQTIIKKPSNASSPEDDEVNRLAVEEDKRRRNTAASARFRIKKKLREQAIERTAADLRERVNELEKEVDGLKRENGWLRGLIIDRTTRDAKAGSATSASTASSSSTSSPPPAQSHIANAKRPRNSDSL